MKGLLAAVFVALVAACSSAPQSSGPLTPATPAPSQAAAGSPQALDFSATLVGGGQLEGGDLAGRDVVLWFWAPW